MGVLFLQQGCPTAFRGAAWLPRCRSGHPSASAVLAAARLDAMSCAAQRGCRAACRNRTLGATRAVASPATALCRICMGLPPSLCNGMPRFRHAACCVCLLPRPTAYSSPPPPGRLRYRGVMLAVGAPVSSSDVASSRTAEHATAHVALQAHNLAPGISYTHTCARPHAHTHKHTHIHAWSCTPAHSPMYTTQKTLPQPHTNLHICRPSSSFWSGCWPPQAPHPP